MSDYESIILIHDNGAGRSIADIVADIEKVGQYAQVVKLYVGGDYITDTVDSITTFLQNDLLYTYIKLKFKISPRKTFKTNGKSNLCLVDTYDVEVKFKTQRTNLTPKKKKRKK